MDDNSVLLDEFTIVPRELQVYRVKCSGTATILWTTQEDVLRYLRNLQARRFQIIERAK